MVYESVQGDAMADFFRGLRGLFAVDRSDALSRGPSAEQPAPRGAKGRHNLFEAAAVHVAACAENDEERAMEAAQWVSPEALAFGTSELACRAVIALARQRRQSPHVIARELLNLPVTRDSQDW